MQKQLLKLLGTGLLAICLGLMGCSKEDTKQDPVSKKTITFGTTVGDFGDMVKFSIKPILEKQGYQVKLIEFTDYVQPNLALAGGSIDVNIFQHKPYLDTFKAERKLDLTLVFQVPTAPLGIYSGRLKTLAEAKEGMQVSLANDPSNFARAVVLLQDAGWLTLKDNTNILTVSERDIAENKYKIQLVQLEAAQIPRARNDVDFAVINGNYAVSAGVPLDSTLFKEPRFDYINWGVVRTKDLETPWVKDVIAAYNSAEFKDYAYKQFVGYKWPANWGDQQAKTVQDKADESTSTTEVDVVLMYR